MEIHWRNPSGIEAKERSAVDRKLHALAGGRTDLIDLWIDLGSETGRGGGTEHATIRALVRRAELVACGFGGALREALRKFERELRELRDRRADRSPG